MTFAKTCDYFSLSQNTSFNRKSDDLASHCKENMGAPYPDYQDHRKNLSFEQNKYHQYEHSRPQHQHGLRGVNNSSQAARAKFQATYDTSDIREAKVD